MKPNQDSRYWIGVVSASHVNVAVEGGFAQLCHGKSALLRQMSAGDWLIYYSPRTDKSTGKPLQAFTAIGHIIDDRIYQYQMSESFVPFRRDLRYLPCRDVKIATLLDQLSFTRENRNWGFPFRKGHFEIGAEDFMMIASSMLEDETQSLLDISLSHKC
ncbi:EVE domain-containing protein [Paenibacillus amylolyticus]|uniref:EVE domain-containing protein n=1 Tax=Paenibacillus amylolyticus TaxID=1451 RepID=UPI000FDC4B77|nr:EVE domain-containing protein [Paenibacillus amylolyticus]